MSLIKFLTLNVCFEREETFGRRFSALVRLLVAKKYDVICLQECVDDLYERLRTSLKGSYNISPLVDSGYYTVMLTKRTLGDANFHRKRLTSQMGRDLLYTDLKRADGGLLTCATVHLESEDNHKIREVQMVQVSEALQNKQNVVIMGDFNFPAHRNYRRNPDEALHNDSLPKCLKEYSDAWVLLYGRETGYTFDHQRNQWKFDNLNKAKGGYRFDRVMVKLDKGNRFKLSSMQLTAGDSIGQEWEGEPYECSMYLSDHLGIEAVISDSYSFAPQLSSDEDTKESKVPATAAKRVHVSAVDDDDEVRFIDEVEAVKALSAEVGQSSSTDRSKASSSSLSVPSEVEMQVLSNLLGEEPSEKKSENIIEVGMTLRGGKRVSRKFHLDSPGEALYWWACLADPSLLSPERVAFALRLPGEVENGSLGSSEELPDEPLSSFPGLNRTLVRIIVLPK